VDARFVDGLDAASLRLEAMRAEAQGAAAVLVRPGPLGDPVVLAAGLSSAVRRALLGACVPMGAGAGAGGRHPALVARELTSLDHVCGGRSILCCPPPFDAALGEALTLCRAMWREGHAVSDGPAYPVPGARHRPRPLGEAGPVVALDLSGGDQSADDIEPELRRLADVVLLPTGDPVRCRMEPTEPTEPA
jgi:alkanesulfonate monooxygenase SsuD/methylene tetrahydromethanopterin reductase-like flavin-dependent oxidoreductase (luciferase family)